MDRETILEKAKKQSDERYMQITAKGSQLMGLTIFTATSLLYLIITLYGVISGEEMISIDLVVYSLMLAFSSGWIVQGYYLYAKLRLKLYLAVGIVSTVASACTIVNIILFFLGIK